MADITGGCLCGRVRYVATGDPAFSGACHCRNCQRYTGSAFEAFIAMPTASVSTTGELKTFEHPGGSGRPVYRRFCPNCVWIGMEEGPPLECAPWSGQDQAAVLTVCRAC